jgi:hypothetical protein
MRASAPDLHEQVRSGEVSVPQARSAAEMAKLVKVNVEQLLKAPPERN